MNQQSWFFQDRVSKRIYLDCYADSREALCKRAAEKYGRTKEQWESHPDSEPVCVELVPMVSGTGKGVTIVQPYPYDEAQCKVVQFATEHGI